MVNSKIAHIGIPDAEFLRCPRDGFTLPIENVLAAPGSVCIRCQHTKAAVVRFKYREFEAHGQIGEYPSTLYQLID